MKLASTLAATLFTLCLSGSALTGCNSEPLEETGPEGPRALTGKDVAGHWVSKGCESYPNDQGNETHLTRDFTLTEAEWDMKVALFGDEACSYPLFTVHVHGPFTLGDPSDQVEGATEGEFGFDTIEWTAHDQGMAETFTAAGCGSAVWSVNEPQDVTATGCIGVSHSKADCPKEFDLVSVEDDELHFGARVTDLCKEEGRPTALSAYAVYEE
jgi:Adenomatosis polyposis coli down-regulated 1